MNPIERLLEIIRGATAKELSEKRCFIISRKDFWEALHLMAQAGMDVGGDETIVRKHTLDNFELILTSGDTQPYYICAACEPVIDKLWEAKK